MTETQDTVLTGLTAQQAGRGGNTPPSLAWTGIPSGAASIAVVMDDPDAIGGTYPPPGAQVSVLDAS